MEKAIKVLARNGITSDLNKRRDIALYHLKGAGEFDPAVCKWESKPTAEKTWANIKKCISTEYAKENKQNKLTAKHFRANALQEQAEAMEELIAMLMDTHTKQMENLVKTTTKAMKEIMLLIQENKTPNVSATDTEKKNVRDEKQKKHNKAPVCKHCGRKHPYKAEDECWELEKNKDSRPLKWKLTKKHLKVRGARIRIRDVATRCD